MQLLLCIHILIYISTLRNCGLLCFMPYKWTLKETVIRFVYAVQTAFAVGLEKIGKNVECVFYQKKKMVECV